MSEAAERTGRLLRVGVGVSVVGVVGLLLLTDLPLMEVVGLAAFYLLLPALAVAQVPLLGTERLERVPVYLGSMVTILLMGAVALFLSGRLEGVVPAGLTLLPAGEFLLWTLGLTLGGIVLILVMHPLEQRVGGARPDVLKELLPRTTGEKGLFVGLSCSAGLGEEAAYRGYAFQVVQLLGFGPWGAAAASAVPFALLHAYQGPMGLVRTGLLGIGLAVPVVLTGSLLPSMAAHALIDVIVGLGLGRRLLGEAEVDSGVVLPPSEA
ncbi:MAG: CPBP family intramembrane glutamic endopeptidase [Gemmatimonadota bacterium]